MTLGVAGVRRTWGYGVMAPVLLAFGVSACTPTAPVPVADAASAITSAPTAAAAGAPVPAGPAALTDQQVLEVVAEMDAALQTGDVEAFLSHVDDELREQQRSWFQAVRDVPMDVRQLRADKVVSRTAATGTVVHVALRHQVSGAGAVPVLEQYRWVLAPDVTGRVRLVDVTGRNGAFHGYPQLWDLGAVAVLRAQDVVLLAPEESRAEAVDLLPQIAEAAGALRRDFPALARGRDVLHVQLAPAEELALMLDAQAGEYVMGADWMRTSAEDPGLERLWLGPAEQTLDHRLLLDLDVMTEDLHLYGAVHGGNTYLRHVGTYAAVAGVRDDHDPVWWVAAGAPTWYELAGDPALKESLLEDVFGAHREGLPERLPGPHWSSDGQEESDYVQASVSLMLFLDESFGREAVLGVVDELHDVSGWYEEAEIWPAVTTTLGTDEEELLGAWQEWVEELLVSETSADGGPHEG
jgi:hypothetical protein